MESEWENYEADPRIKCKYGSSCYQKNPDHKKRFKHPPPEPEKKRSAEKASASPPSKKFKVEGEEDNFTEKTNAEDNSEKTESVLQTHESDCEEDDTKITDSSSPGKEEFLPESPADVKENIRQKYLVEMPQDFYDFWSFCKTLNEDHPEDAFVSVGLKPVGPYDILSCKFKGAAKTLSQWLCHWRFYHDPPEFQTVIVGEENEFRIGYFRDDPSEEPVFTASMSSSKQGTISPKGENIFSALSSYLNSKLTLGDPFQKTIVQKRLKEIETFAKEKNYNLNLTTDVMKKRQKKVVSKTFHGAGIVVPVNADTDVGYREIPETNANLKRILKRIVDAPTKETKMQRFEDLQELLTNVQFATDEGDFGMGLELGIDLFIYGGEEFHRSIRHLLTVAYELLGRLPFAEIIKAHLQNREKGPDMSRL